MPATREQIERFLNSEEWTYAEKEVIKWQFRLHGDFKTALFQAIIRADDDNLDKLALGFPDQVAGYRAWTNGNLGQRFRKAGLGI